MTNHESRVSKPKKLTLSVETIRVLEPSTLDRAVGGQASGSASFWGSAPMPGRDPGVDAQAARRNAEAERAVQCGDDYAWNIRHPDAKVTVAPWCP